MKAPKAKSVEPPKTYVSAETPAPEETAEAPSITDAAQTADDRRSKRKGTSALTIDLNLGGTSGGYTNPVNLPY